MSVKPAAAKPIVRRRRIDSSTGSQLPTLLTVPNLRAASRSASRTAAATSEAAPVDDPDEIFEATPFGPQLEIESDSAVQNHSKVTPSSEVDSATRDEGPIEDKSPVRLGTKTLQAGHWFSRKVRENLGTLGTIAAAIAICALVGRAMRQKPLTERYLVSQQPTAFTHGVSVSPRESETKIEAVSPDFDPASLFSDQHSPQPGGDQAIEAVGRPEDRVARGGSSAPQPMDTRVGSRTPNVSEAQFGIGDANVSRNSADIQATSPSNQLFERLTRASQRTKVKTSQSPELSAIGPRQESTPFSPTAEGGVPMQTTAVNPVENWPPSNPSFGPASAGRFQERPSANRTPVRNFPELPAVPTNHVRPDAQVGNYPRTSQATLEELKPSLYRWIERNRQQPLAGDPRGASPGSGTEIPSSTPTATSLNNGGVIR